MADILDEAARRIERLEEKYGDRFKPPVLLRRLVAQGRHGMKAGQGFYPYPQPDEGEQADTVKLETRGEVAIDLRELVLVDGRIAALRSRSAGAARRVTGPTTRWRT